MQPIEEKQQSNSRHLVDEGCQLIVEPTEGNMLHLGPIAGCCLAFQSREPTSREPLVPVTDRENRSTEPAKVMLTLAGTCTQDMTYGLASTYHMVCVPAAIPRARRAAMWCTQESMTKPPGQPSASLQQQQDAAGSTSPAGFITAGLLRLAANTHLKHDLNRKNNRDRINIGIPKQVVKLVISMVSFSIGSKSAKHKRGWDSTGQLLTLI
ncbi:MAG: hypothetical protein FRX49_07953 [Trebouxia sp. A1-2]|nr:MAG: hypothetical protein FRX49_07953 [Trebouxia sp. A1-2]